MKRRFTTLIAALCACAATATVTAQERTAAVFDGTDGARVESARISSAHFKTPQSDVMNRLSADALLLRLPTRYLDLQRLISPGLIARAASKSASSETVYCLTNNLQEVWADEEWDPFFQTIQQCDDLGNRTVSEAQSHYQDAWELSHRQLFYYNELGDWTEFVTQFANTSGTAYENRSRSQFEYNEGGQETLHLEQDWDGAMWVNDEQRIRDYEDGLNTGTLQQEWDGATWVNVERETASPEDSTALTEIWDGSMWVPDTQVSLEQVGGLLVVTSQLWDGTQWVNDFRYTESPELRRVESWDGAAWIGQQNQLLSRDAFGNIVELIEQEWDGAGWVNDYRATYVFDPSGSFQTEFQLDEWEDSQWKDNHRQLSTLDANGNEIEELWQDWDDATSQWEDLQRYLRTFEAINVAIESRPQLAGFSLSQNHPNPVRSHTTIRFELAHAADASITLFDVLGRTVKTLHAGATSPGPQDLEVYVGGLANGMYYYRLRSGDVVLTRQMMVVR
jgi:hypothetical protein